jgi:hypothetical protein
MELTSRIKSVEPIGKWSNGQRDFNKFRVSFANGDILSFLAVNDFKGNVGDDLTYEKNPQYGTGKIVRDENRKSYSNNSKTDDTQTYIIRQSMLKAAIDFHADNHGKTEDRIIETAKYFVNYVING